MTSTLHSGMSKIGVDIDAEQPGDVLPLADAEDVVDRGRLLAHLAAVELGHAAGDDERLAVAFAGRERAHSLHGLFLALFDEAAGVDDDGVGIFRLEHGQQFAAGQQPFEVLAIDIVLGAAEGDEVVRLRYGHQEPVLTAMLTVRPVVYWAAGAGAWLKTWPFGALLEAGSWFTLNPAAVMAAVALSAVIPMTLGTAAGTPAAIVPAGAVPVAAPMDEAQRVCRHR